MATRDRGIIACRSLNYIFVIYWLCNCARLNYMECFTDELNCTWMCIFTHAGEMTASSLWNIQWTYQIHKVIKETHVTEWQSSSSVVFLEEWYTHPFISAGVMICKNHYSDVTGASWLVKAPETLLFVQPILQQEYIKLLLFFCEGIKWGMAGCLHKEPVMCKAFAWNDLNMTSHNTDDHRSRITQAIMRFTLCIQVTESGGVRFI